MSDRLCKRCLFGDQCRCIGRCEYYSPTDEDASIEKYIEDERERFRAEWLSYINEDRENKKLFNKG